MGARGPARVPITVRFARMLPADLDPAKCWPWRGQPSAQGYGRLRAGGKGSPVLLAHRLSYELHVGPIPDGLTLDHLCHTNDETCVGGDDCPHRMCVNPAHLEPVTQGVNTKRGRAPTVLLGHANVCARGHSLIEHGYIRKDRPGRNCNECRRERRAAA